MIKGLAITPPVIGRISIGKVIEKDGKRLPSKDDQFTITSQIYKNKDWLKHPIDDQLRYLYAEKDKLRKIPVKMVFNDPDLNLRAEYTLFDRQTGRPFCIGNGESCQRLGNNGVEHHPCPSPSACPLAQNGQCKPYGRLHVTIDNQDDIFGTFIFRTTGFNSIRTLAARLSYYHAVSDGLLSCLPLQLTLRSKCTAQSYRQPIYYVDLVLKDCMSLSEAIAEAKQTDERNKAAGINQDALDRAARQGYNNAVFDVDVDDEEGLDVMDEFYPPQTHIAEPSYQPTDIKQQLRQSVKPIA